MKSNGKPWAGEIDILWRDRWGFIETAEVKFNQSGYRIDQLERIQAISEGRVSFYGASAKRWGLDGSSLLSVTDGGRFWGGNRLWVGGGNGGGNRALRKYFRFMFGRD